jgi:hypothetical protein
MASRKSVGLKLQGALAKLYTHLFWVFGKARMPTLLVVAHPINVAIVSAFVYSVHTDTE